MQTNKEPDKTCQAIGPSPSSPLWCIWSLRQAFHRFPKWVSLVHYLLVCPWATASTWCSSDSSEERKTTWFPEFLIASKIMGSLSASLSWYSSILSYGRCCSSSQASSNPYLTACRTSFRKTILNILSTNASPPAWRWWTAIRWIYSYCAWVLSVGFCCQSSPLALACFGWYPTHTPQ